MFDDPAALTAHDAPQSLWNRLARQTPQPDPFCALTAWQLSFRDAMDPGRPYIVRHNEDGLVQFALHVLGKTPVLGPIERLWLFGCNVLGPAGPDLLEQLVDEIPAVSGNRCTRFGISGIDPEGVLALELRKRFEGRCSILLLREDVQGAASLVGGLDGFLSRRSPSFRRNLRNSERRAARAGVQFERHCPTTPYESDAVFQRMITIEQKSWKAGGGMDEGFSSVFYAAMLRRLSASRDGRVVLATRDGEDVGFIFGGMIDGIYRGQQFSFADACRDLSLGNLLQREMIAWLCEQGAERYDLGPARGPFMDYKASWAELEFPMESWVLSV